MKRFSYILLIFTLLLGHKQSFAQLDGMTQEELRQKAKEMGYNIDDYIKKQTDQSNSYKRLMLKKMKILLNNSL